MKKMYINITSKTRSNSKNKPLKLHKMYKTSTEININTP